MENEIKKDKSREFLAAVLIFIGGVWLLSEMSVYLNIHRFFENFIYPFHTAIKAIARIVFSWQIIFIIIGIVLLAGQRRVGVVFVVLGTLFLIPRIFLWDAFNFSLFFPLLLIGIGITFMVKLK